MREAFISAEDRRGVGSFVRSSVQHLSLPLASFVCQTEERNRQAEGRRMRIQRRGFVLAVRRERSHVTLLFPSPALTLT